MQLFHGKKARMLLHPTSNPVVEYHKILRVLSKLVMYKQGSLEVEKQEEPSMEEFYDFKAIF